MSFTTNVFASEKNIIISDHISLYNDDNHKYKSGFKHFSYVNPNALKGGKITLPAYGGFDNFNPFILKGIAQGETSYLTLESLGYVPSDDHTNVYPWIAEKFELPKDKSFVGFFINPKAKFIDNSPITADDVIFSFNSLIEKGSPIYKPYFSDIEKVEKVSDLHIRFIFKKGSKNRELPLIVSSIDIFSKKDWEGKDFSKPSLIPYLGSGAYTILKFEPSKYVIFKRNKNYWAQNLPSRKGFFNFDEIRYDYYQDTTVTLQALFSGNVDARTEYVAKNWVTSYNNDKIKNKEIIKNKIQHNNAAIFQNFSFNIRNEKFQDRKVRKAISLAFNFDWANEKLFYSQYNRLYSHFTNTGMEAIELPEGRELEILNKYKDKLDKEIFTEKPKINSSLNSEEIRSNLREAVLLLQEAGYDFVDGKMTNLSNNKPLEFEVISNSVNGSVFTRVMLPFIGNLKKIGIDAKFRTLELNVFNNVIETRQFDIAILGFSVSKTPGNEQRELWGSNAADRKGSVNRVGIKNPIIDELVEGIITSDIQEDYVAYVRALDRILLYENYMIPQWYSAYDRVAYWDKFGIPEENNNTGYNIFTWWIK